MSSPIAGVCIVPFPPLSGTGAVQASFGRQPRPCRGGSLGLSSSGLVPPVQGWDAELKPPRSIGALPCWQGTRNVRVHSGVVCPADHSTQGWGTHLISPTLLLRTRTEVALPMADLFGTSWLLHSSTRAAALRVVLDAQLNCDAQLSSSTYVSSSADTAHHQHGGRDVRLARQG